MVIRKYQPCDCNELAELFYNTVHTINATAICDKLEQTVQGKVVTHASITAKPFFEKRGYRIIKEQQVERKGIFLTNFVMEKE